MSPLVPLPRKLNHSFSQCFLSSTPLYAHRLAPSLVTFPRRFSQDIVRGGRKRAFLSNKRKGDWRMWKASIQAGSQGLGAATSSGGRRGLLLLSRGWARDPGQGPGAMQRLLGWRWSVGASSASASPLLDSGLLAFNLLAQTISPCRPSTLRAKAASRLQDEECVSINRAVRLSQRLTTGMSRFLKGMAVTYFHPAISFPLIFYEFILI